MKTCYVMVGLPATGKSTMAEAMLDANPLAFVYSTDAYIEECAAQNGITYNDAFTDFIEPATKSMNERVEIAIRSGQDVIWDQTNTGVKKRTKIVNRMRQAGYCVECHFVRPPEAGHISDQKTWRDRLNGRPGKTIPDHIMTSMFENLVEPTVDEGFDRVYTYNMFGNLIKD